MKKTNGHVLKIGEQNKEQMHAQNRKIERTTLTLNDYNNLEMVQQILQITLPKESSLFTTL